MVSQSGKYLLMAASGTISGLLGLPFIAGAVKLPNLALAFLPGFIFALLVSITITSIYPATRFSSSYLSRFFPFVVLMVGMPIALGAGVAILNLADRFMPGAHQQFGGISISFIIAEVAACVIWSFLLCMSLFLLCKVRVALLLLPSLVTTLSVMIVMNVVYAGFTIFLQKSVPLTFTSIAEQMASALLLGIGMAKGANAERESGFTASS